MHFYAVEALKALRGYSLSLSLAPSRVTKMYRSLYSVPF